MYVKSIKLRLIFNSFGDEVIEAVINDKYVASSTFGISKSSHRALEVPVEKGIRNFNKIKKKFIGEFTQRDFDRLLKKYMKVLGSAVTTSLSLAFFSSSRPKKGKVPRLLGNVLGGGMFSFSKTKTEIQEILVSPKTKDIKDAIRINFKIWHEVKDELKKRRAILGLNPESAWLSTLDNERSLDLVRRIARRYNADVGIDFAASHIFKKGKYVYHNRSLGRDRHVDYVINLIKSYNLFYVEDPVEENDFEGFAEIKKKTKALICGDDLTATHPERVKEAVKRKSINSVLIKPNQAGTVTDTLEVFKIANKYKLKTVVSHRSKETCCPVVAKLALISDFAKFGVGGIRICKLNELIRLL